jgi:hypothetical protein
MVDAKFADSSSNRLGITRICLGKSLDSSGDLRASGPIAQTFQPIRELDQLYDLNHEVYPINYIASTS